MGSGKEVYVVNPDVVTPHVNTVQTTVVASSNDHVVDFTA